MKSKWSLVVASLLATFATGVMLHAAVTTPVVTNSAGKPLEVTPTISVDASGNYAGEGSTSPTGVTYTDASITSATGASQTVAAALAGRKGLTVANPGTTTWWVNPSGGTASANCAGCFEMPPGSMWTPKPAPVNAVTGIGTATSKLTVVGG